MAHTALVASIFVPHPLNVSRLSRAINFHDCLKCFLRTVRPFLSLSALSHDENGPKPRQELEQEVECYAHMSHPTKSPVVNRHTLTATTAMSRSRKMASASIILTRGT